MRFFETKHFAEEFMRGNIFMSSLESFRKLESEDGDTARGDCAEGVIAQYCPSQSIIQIGDIIIPSEDIAAPIRLDDTHFKYRNACCMHAIRTPNRKHTIDEFKSHFILPESIQKFGDHIVLINNAPEFIKRFSTACRSHKFWGKANFVKYLPNDHYGYIPNADRGFTKSDRYAYQQEYRLLIDRDVRTSEPYIFNIGTIQDITQYIPTNEFSNAVKVHVKA